jgi:hypothetical protein
VSNDSSATAATAEGLAFSEGLRETRHAFARWRGNPSRVLGPWFLGALLIACGLLAGVWLVAVATTPDPTSVVVAGVSDDARPADALPILGRNLLVLALHATACVAGFIAGSSMRRIAESKTGVSRWVHEKAGPVAIAWVVAVTGFSLLTQILGLGFTAATLSWQYAISPGTLILTVLPHALLELTAVFLPLAAWLIASRRDEWGDLLAATFLTVALALPMLLASAAIELLLWPHLLEAVSPWA